MRERGTSSLAMVFVALLLLPTLYVGSYLALLSPQVRLGMSEDGVCRERRSPRYRLGGKAAKQVFGPIHAADRQVRQAYWEEEVR